MKKSLLFGLILIILIFNGCTSSPEGVDPRVSELTADNAQLDEKISGLESQITDLEDKLTKVTNERDEYLQELDDFYLTEITGDVDLIYWNDQDIVDALGDYNDKFKASLWKTYVYRRDTKDFYWQIDSSLGFIDDPFFELRRKDQDHELSVFHFRIERLALNNNRSLGQEDYTKYVQNVLKEVQIDSDLSCFEQTTCRDVKVIKCIKNSKNYYAWFEGSHLFTSRFDGREALDTFEKLYCHPDPTIS